MRALVVAVLAAVAPFAATPLSAYATGLPQNLAPPSPFPAIRSQAPTIEHIAPGVEYGDYSLLTADGPLAIHVIAIEPGHSDVHVENALAGDALASSGETISSMAARTGAIAGINGDYFAIGSTDAPTNIVVHDQQLLRTPRNRAALLIRSDGTPAIAEESFTGSLQVAGKNVELDAVNVMPPPHGGVTLLTPQFGAVEPSDQLTLVALAPQSGTPPFGTYRVTGVLDNLTAQPPGYYIAVGINAYGGAGVPNVGDLVSASGDLSPVALGTLDMAVGGGPRILQDGAWVNDPDGPSGAGYAGRIPCSGAATAPDGTLFLLEVDGRQPGISIGLRRHEFASLMRGLGATQGMAFDGGGSSELVARRLGYPDVSLQGSPSDGRERPVAEGVFVYSTAPLGPPAAVVAQPQTLRMLSGASVAFHVAAIDASDHVVTFPAPPKFSVAPAALAVIRNGEIVARHSGDGVVYVRSGTLTTTLALRVEPFPANVAILPNSPNAIAGEAVHLRVVASDARGFPIAVPTQLPWQSTSGSISRDGTFVAQQKNAIVTVAVGNRRVSTLVTVGSHETELNFAAQAHFATIPLGGAGSALLDPACDACLQLSFALGPTERAAYALAQILLPTRTIGLAFDLRDDGSGARLRVALRNGLGEQVLITATTLDRPGWRRVLVHFPPALVDARLDALYVIGSNGDATRRFGGSIVIRNLHAIIAGSE